MAKLKNQSNFSKNAKSFLLATLLIGTNLSSLATPLPTELPSGYQVQAGNVTFDNSVSNILNINSASAGSIVNYQSFSIGRDSIVNLNLPSSSSAILNRVVGSNVSEIFGQMNSNGRVFLVNPSGILFGTGSQVNVGSLFASTLPINDNDFLNGIHVFSTSPASLTGGAIINNGSLKGTESINLFAGAINNAGSIEAPVVHLAVGDKITASLGGGVSVNVVVNDELKQKVNGLNDAISNSGSIKGAFVNLKTNLESGIYENAVNNSGLVKASSLLDILGQTQNTIQETQTITETVINDNGTPADPTDDFSEQVQKQVLVDKVVTSSDGTVKNSSDLQGGSLKIEAGVLENNPNSTIQSTIGNIDIQLSGSKTASVAPLDNTLVHNGSSPPTQRVFGYVYEEISSPFNIFQVNQPNVVRINGKYYRQVPVLNETISYSLLNKGTIQSANDLNIKSTNGPIINRSGSNWNASLKSANDMTLDAPNILNQRGGFYTTYRYQLNKSSNNDYYEWWTDQAPATNASIDAGNDLKIKQGNFSNQSGSVKVGNNLDFTGTNFSNLTKVLQQTEHHHWTKRGIIRRFDRDTWYINSARGPMASLYVEKDANFGTLSNPMNNFTNTGLIDVGNFNANGSGNFVNGITDRNIQNPDGQIPGTISSRGDFRLNAESYDIPIGTFLNTGFIEADETVKIKAQKIQNVRRTARAIDNVLTSKGFFNDKKMKQIEYEQLQSGGEIRGHNIELIASEEFVNRGGIISVETFPTESSAKNYLLAVMNDPELVREAGTLKISAPKIINEVAEGEKVVSWDNGNLGDFLGMKNWDKASVYAPGQLVSDGTITLEATNKDNTGTVINRGSDIIANGDIKIKADKLVEQDWVASHHTVSDKVELKGLKITRDKETAHVTRGSTIASTEGNINIEVGNETTDGTFRNTASDVLANKNIDISAKNIEISDAIHQSWDRHTEAGLFKAELPGFTQFGYIDTKNTVTTQQSSNLVAGGNISLRSPTGASSGSSISITGSNVIADGNVSLKAENISIKNGEYTDQFKQTGFTTQAGYGLSNPRGGGMTTVWQTNASQEHFTPSNIISGKTLSIDSTTTDIKSSNLAANEKIAIKADNLSISGDWEKGESNTNFASLGAEVGISKSPNGIRPGVTITATGGNSNSENGNFIASSLNAPNIELNGHSGLAGGSLDGTFINGQGVGMPDKTTYSNTESTAISASVTIGPGYFIPGASYTHLENGKGFSIGGSTQGPSGAFIDGAWSFGGSLSKPTDSLSTSFSPFVYNSDVGLGFSTTLGQTKGTSSHWYVSPNLLTPIGPVGGTFQGGQLVGITVGPYSELINNFNYTCFVAGTQITLGNKEMKAIEEIKVGDKVLSWNEKTNEVGVKEVEKTFIRQAKKILKLTLSNGSILETTPDHPFWNVSKDSHSELVSGKWVNAGDLKLGDKLLNVNLEEVFVHSIEEEAGTTVYNFEVKDNHTYFAENILVHNAEKYSDAKGQQQLDAGNAFLSTQENYQYVTPRGETILSIGAERELTLAIDIEWRDDYNQSLNTLIQVTSNNPNLTPLERDRFTQQLIQIQLASAAFSPKELNQYSNPVNQQAQNTILQIKRAQAVAAYNAGLFIFGDKGNLDDAQKQIFKIISSIDRDTSLSPGQKAQLKESWQKVNQEYSDPQTKAVLANVLRPLASLLGAAGIVRLGPVILAGIQTFGAKALIPLAGLITKYGPTVTMNFINGLRDPISSIEFANGDFSSLFLGPTLELAGEFGKRVLQTSVFKEVIESQASKAIAQKIDDLKNYLGDLDFGKNFKQLGSKLDDLIRGNPKLTSKELDLAFDPAQKKINLDELNNALKAEEKLGVQLKRNPIEYVDGSPKTGADFIDPITGKTYDDFGTGPIESKFLEQFNSGLWKENLVKHLNKSDVTILDLSKLSDSSKAQVMEFLKTLTPQQIKQIVILGE